MSDTISINSRTIGPGQPAYIIAELSANHHGEYARAEAVVRAAADAGADAIKLQTYTADSLTLDCDEPPFQIGEGTIWSGRTLYDLYSEAATPYDWHEPLRDLAHELGLDFFSTPFDEEATDFLDDLGVPAFKIASFELVHIPLLRHVATKGKPIILSTGMGTVEEIDEAVAAVGDAPLALLRTNSAYPAPPDQMNLRAMDTLAERYRVPIGLSDHTLGWTVAVAAIARGATIIEKHLTLSRDQPGPDSAFSMEPAEFQAMVQAIRTTEAALGSPEIRATEKEHASREFRRSIYTTAPIRAGEPFTRDNIKIIRPAGGLHPRCYEDLLGCTTTRDMKLGEPISTDILKLGYRECRR